VNQSDVFTNGTFALICGLAVMISIGHCNIEAEHEAIIEAFANHYQAVCEETTP